VLPVLGNIGKGKDSGGDKRKEKGVNGKKRAELRMREKAIGVGALGFTSNVVRRPGRRDKYVSS